VAVSVDQIKEVAAIGSAGAGASVAVPLAIFVLGVWMLLDLPHGLSKGEKTAGPIAAAAILVTPFTPQPVFVCGLVMTVLIAFKVTRRLRETAA
jgi:hypothetical protein